MSWISKKDKDPSSQQAKPFKSLEEIRAQCDEYVLDLDTLKWSPIRFFNKLQQRYFFKDKETLNQTKQIIDLHEEIESKDRELQALENKIEKWWNELKPEQQFERINKFYGSEPWENNNTAS